MKCYGERWYEGSIGSMGMVLLFIAFLNYIVFLWEENMNHIYKVIWSRVKNSYVVVSEIAGTARKSGRVRVSKNTLAAVLAAFLLTGISVSPVSAALDGVNTFVEPGNQNIKIGNGTDLRNNSTKNGAIAIGDHAQIDDYVMQEGSIAVGKNAFVENMWGTQDKIFRFGMHSTDPSRTDHLLPAGIAIGQNTYARSGSLMIGDHKYVGALGDTTVNSNTDDEKRKLSVLVGATTVGLNSYSAGAFATTTGAYSIMTNAYDGNTNQGSAAQNFGAVINGSFNSIESKTSGSSVSGIANAVVGTANRTHNANGTLVFGAGNEVTNSVDNIANPMSFLGINSPKELAEKLREDIRRNDSGGAVLAIGGGNKADYAYRSQLVGVGNTLTGTAAEKAAYNLLNGYKNTGTNVSGVTVIGTNRTVSNAKDTIVMGSSAGGITTTASKAVILGSEANAEKDGGVALGADSVASVDKDIAGYDPSTKLASANTSAAWKATHAAVSVGNGSTATRQITGVAAGTNDTDAVNVAQLKAIAGGTGSIHFVSVKGGNASSVNYNNDGAKETGAIAIGANAEATANSAVAMGFNAQSNGSGSIVIGESSGLIPDVSKRGASKGNSSIIIGTENVDKGGTKDHAGSNDGILGSNNTIQESNGAFVTGAFNHVSDSYQFGQLSASEQQKLAQAMADGKPLGKYIGKWGSHVFVTGDGNTVSQGMNVTISGSQNTVENSKSQTVIGDSNKITDRNAGTVSGKQEERTKNVSDLVIGKGNDISGNDTYMKGYESLTVIGNNNKAVNPSSSIVIGDNQRLSAIEESVVIGSMTPEEKADPDIGQKHASVVVGYHAQSGTRDGGGMNVALGHGAKAYGWQETVTGIKSIVEAGSGYDGYLASVYGGLNTVASNKADQNDGMANTVVGTLNKTEGANGALVFGAGNSVTHSFGTAPTDEDGNSMNEHWSDAILGGGQKYAMGEGPLGHDELRKAMGLAMSTGGGSVVTMGNGNTSDYAVHSQIIGSGNILTGTANTPSINNTINGYGNTGRNVERMSMMGTGNNMSGSTADVVIGDYHHMDGGKNNVILGSMATEKKTVTKTYTMKDASGNVILEKKYKVTENVPIKSHTANISNAVMLGYNTDVEKDGGVAIGADSIASVDKGVAGYDPAAGDHSNDTTGTWKATAAAVSVGKAATPTSAAVTRQITNVAAGTQDTDAVNVAQLKKVQAAVGAAKVHYYSAKSTKTGAGSNYDNDGAEAEDSIVLGISSSSKGVNSTVLGNNNKLTGVKNGRNNSIVAGQNLEVEGAHNAVFGTDYNNYDHKLTKVFGEQNTVIGVGNLVGYTAEKDPSDPTKWIYTKSSSGSDQNVAVGMTNTANGGSVVVGTSSEAENLGVSFGHGNKVIGSNSGGGQRGLALGNYLTVKGEEAVAVGTNASATADWAIAMGKNSKAEKETAMAFGYDSHAKVAGGVALGSWSVVDTAAGVSGYDPSTKAASTDTSAAWKSTVGAVSVGDASKGITRQITGVAAGAADTDVVNVAQLKKAVAGAADGNDTLVSGSNGLSLSGKTLSMSVKDTAGNEVKGSVDLSSVADGNDTLVGDNNALTLNGKELSMKIKDTAGNEVKGSVDLSAIAGQIDTNTTYTMSGTQNADNTTTITLKGSDGKENKVTVATKDTRNTVKAGENVTLDTAANTFGGTEYTVNVKADGKVENGSTKIVSGNTVYHETHVKNDGNYVKKENSAGDNLTILDKQVGKNTTNITNLGNTINNLNGKLGTLDNRISKVGAGAAALAALHPLDFDPHDKWDIAAGFGNYRNASAAAVGLFYRPNERTMMSLGWTMGDDRNMINAGISVKLGRGDVYTRYSKVEMANQIKDLKEKNDKMQAENKEMRSELDELKAQVAALAAKK
ncbi:ESPR-type extended signal peptide-containing protein [Dialister invisus]|uniref:ESPR-type extended signal peptide-containing protein n=1 Tax=Dialister invisus TaxID=218538 RepID=UPI00265E4DED|nr:ESPR-type extended signal peptide-containing protein [Dialister invisus]